MASPTLYYLQNFNFIDERCPCLWDHIGYLLAIDLSLSKLVKYNGHGPFVMHVELLGSCDLI